MINHLRTLLLNLPADSSGLWPGVPGEEYVQPGYVPQALPQFLLPIQTALYGPGYDRAMANLRLRELLYVVHSTELAGYATALDPRITYWPPHEPRLFRALCFGAAANQVSGATCALSFQSAGGGVGTGTNRLLQRWQVAVINSTQVQVTTGDGVTTTYTYAITGGLSNPIPLPGSRLSAIFATPGSPLPAWTVTSLAQPNYPFPQVFTGLQLAGVDLVFDEEAVEPYTTLGKLWRQGNLATPYRIAAAAIALGYRINDIANGRGRGYVAPPLSPPAPPPPAPPPAPPRSDALLLESGDNLLLEDGTDILLLEG